MNRHLWRLMLLMAASGLAGRASAQTYGPAVDNGRYPLPQVQPSAQPSSQSPQPTPPAQQPKPQFTPVPSYEPGAPGYAPDGPPQRYPLNRPPAIASVTDDPDPATIVPNEPQAQPSGDLFEPAQILAIVGDQYIFYGDVAPTINQVLAPIVNKAQTPGEKAELAKLREHYTRQILRQFVESKLLYLEFERQIVKNAGDKIADVRKDIERRTRDAFEQQLSETLSQMKTADPSQLQKIVQREPTVGRLALLMLENNAESLSEAEALLRPFGSSIEKQMRTYRESMLGRQMVSKSIDRKPEVTHQEIIDYYREKAAEFAVPAKCRFEILTVKFTSFPSKTEAWNKIAQMGNEVYFGAPFATIARKHSEEPHAEQGGYYDWTTQGSLASEVIDQAIFTLEPGKLSAILEDSRGYHIVRVLERTQAGQVDFIEAQPGIKDAIIAQKRQADINKYVESLRAKTPVWTIYDDEPTAAANDPSASRR